jgi:hypothetical protein
MTLIIDPKHYLRKERDSLLADTERDGRGLPDRAFSEAELTYRQELRDMPALYADIVDPNEVTPPLAPTGK